MSEKAAGAYTDPVPSREPASPEMGGRDRRSLDGPSPPPTGSSSSQNGLHHGSGSESDSGVDAPLDFSMKKPQKRELESPEGGVAKRLALSKGDHSDSNSLSPVPRVRVKVEPENLSQSPPAPDDVKNGTDGGRLGEPPAGLPGALPGAVGAAMPGLPAGLPAGMLPNAFAANLPLYMDPRRLQQVQQAMSTATASNGNSNSKSSARPFKAYPKDALSLPLGYYGIPGMLPFPSIDSVSAQCQAMGMNSEDLFNQYRMYVLKCQQEQAARGGSSAGKSGVSQQSAPPTTPQQPPQQPSPVTPSGNSTLSSQASPSAKSTTSETSSTIRSTSSSPTLSTTCTTPTSPGGLDSASLSVTGSGGDPMMSGSGEPSSGMSTPSRKPGIQMPDERKDEAYWERRRKNNEAAKRSRDSRRAKEDEIAIRAAFLEQENLKLRVEVAALKNETAKLRCMLYNS